MTAAPTTSTTDRETLTTLSAIERRVLWLAVRIVDYANRERPKGDALKVGGHQASSASMVTLMTALYLADLRAEDRVSVKPHASPVLQAIEYLLGRLDRSYLTRLRDFGGLQSYPSRTKDPYPGRLLDRLGRARIGCAAVRRARRPLHADAARRLDRRPLHLAARRRRARRGQHLGGARGSADATARQRALDRRPEPAVARPGDPRDPRRRARGAVPHERLERDRAEVRPPPARGVRARGRRRAPSPDRRDAERAVPVAVRRVARRSCAQTVARRRSAASERAALERLLESYEGGVAPLVRDLGGHDLGDVLDAFRRARETTGPADGDLRVHDQGLRPRDRRTPAEPLRAPRRGDRSTGSARRSGSRPRPSGTASRRARPRHSSSPGARQRLDRGAAPPAPPDRGPDDAVAARPGRHLDTGRVRPGPARPLPRRRRRRAARHGRAGRLALDEPRRLHQQDRRLGARRGARLRRDGGLAAQVARRATRAAHRDGDRGDEPRAPARPARPQLGLPARAALPDRDALRPVRDARARRHRLLDLLGLALRPRRHAVRISLSREGGAHQSLITPGIGIETPGLTYAEPCYARELEWLLLDALDAHAGAGRRGALPAPLDEAGRPGAVRCGGCPGRRGAPPGRCRRRRIPPARARRERRSRHPRRLRRDRPRDARGRGPARRRGRRRGDRALPLVARPALPRLAGTAGPRRSRRHAAGVVPPRAARPRPTSVASRS